MGKFMAKEGIFKIALWLVIFVFFANALAMKYYWYYSFWWFDMPMHFLGGAFIGLVSVAVYLSYFGKKSLKDADLIVIPLLSAFLIGILWEFFEFSLDTFITYKANDFADTSSDIFFDLAGAAAAGAFLLYNKNK